MDGVLVIDKPVGPTSHDIVAAARRALGIRRIGHTGTLDPLAAGVLALVLGQATRLAQHLTATDKEYEAAIRFGVETDSYDSAGKVMAEGGGMPSREWLEQTLPQFRGTFQQVPPVFSAKKLKGDRAYDLARRDPASVRLAAVDVTAHALDLLAYEPPRVRVRLVCSPGFYVRSLAHDLGVAAGTGAILEALLRTRSGPFPLTGALPLGELATASREALAAKIIPLDRLLDDLPAVRLTADASRRARHGQDVAPADLPVSLPADRLVRLLDPDGRMVGLARPAEIPGFLHPSLIFS